MEAIQFMTAKDVARLAKVKVATVQAWVRQGKLLGRKVGRQYLFLVDDVLAALRG